MQTKVVLTLSLLMLTLALECKGAIGGNDNHFPVQISEIYIYTSDVHASQSKTNSVLCIFVLTKYAFLLRQL